MKDQVYKNHIGLAIDAQVVDDDTGEAIDLSGASTLQLKLKAPGQAASTKTATLINSGTDGWVRYVTVANDLTVIGVWEVQGYFVDGSEQFHTSIDTFRVRDTL